MRLKIIGLLFFALFICAPVHAQQIDLQATLDAAEKGAVIDVPAGYYKGPFIITKQLTLRGHEGTVIVSSDEEPAITIEKATDVTIENIKIKATGKAIVASDVTSLTLKNLVVEDVHTGIHIQRASDVEITNVTVVGNDQHYSKKGNGIAVYKSSEVHVNNCNVQGVQDGIYIEEVQQVKIENNQVANSRYGTHFMYTKDAFAKRNDFQSNVTGLMVMMTENLLIEENKVAGHDDLNGYGLLLFDVQNTQLYNNDLLGNRVGVALQKSTAVTIEENAFTMNQTAIEVVGADEESVVQRNMFTGNILTARSDQNGIVLSQNYYDDYTGLDVDEDGTGDTPYAAFSSFGQWMVRQSVYQYFVESPSVVLLTSLDRQVNKTEQTVLVDKEPKLKKSVIEKRTSAINGLQLTGGLFLLMMSLFLWGRGMR